MCTEAERFLWQVSVSPPALQSLCSECLSSLLGFDSNTEYCSLASSWLRSRYCTAHDALWSPGGDLPPAACSGGKRALLKAGRENVLYVSRSPVTGQDLHPAAVLGGLHPEAKASEVCCAAEEESKGQSTLAGRAALGRCHVIMCHRALPRHTVSSPAIVLCRCPG